MKNIRVKDPVTVEGSLRIEKYYTDRKNECIFEEKNLIVLSSRQFILSGIYSEPGVISFIAGAANHEVTVTTSVAHGMITGDMVIIAGVNPLEYNGTYPITLVDPTTFKYFSLAEPSVANGSGSEMLFYPVTSPDPIQTLQVGIGGSMDSRTIANCSIDISTNIVTSLNPDFLITDVGQAITIQGAGPGSSSLNVLVNAYNSPTSITISDSAYTTVSNISVTIGQGLFPNQENPAQTSLVAPVATLSTIFTVNDTTPSVTYVADLNQASGNGYLLTEAGLIKLSGNLFNIKNFPGIPKTSDFGVHFVWTIKYA